VDPADQFGLVVGLPDVDRQAEVPAVPLADLG